MNRGVQLIAYADRFGGDGLATLRDLLNGPLAGAFSGVHILPFYTPFDGADAGFDPRDHRRVDPRLGSWEDIRAIAENHDVMADLIANHISDESPQFRDFLTNGEASEFADMFLQVSSVFPGGFDAAELGKIYRPRPGFPFTDKPMQGGSTRRFWTTFTPHQIDLDMASPRALSYLMEVLDRFAAAGVTDVRLDAIGYAIKTPGTSCFMTPETMEFIERIGAEVNRRGMASLLEIHSHYTDQIRSAEIADHVYDFALPPLVLHSLFTGSPFALHAWLGISPRNVFTVLDTHDGIGVIDVGAAGNKPGLLAPEAIDGLVREIHRRSEGESARATGAAASNLDLYQVNCTYYSALGCDDDEYLLARLVQFLCPGTPQVYYAGLLAAPNDMRLLAETGVGRDINRPYYSREAITEQLRRPVVDRLLAMARFRNRHPAFAGTFSLGAPVGSALEVAWHADQASVSARLDFATATFEIEASEGSAVRTLGCWNDF